MAKATHTGTCQCCGNAQKLPNGVLPKHGYTVDWGMFSGVCQGAGHLPFEQDHSLIEKFIQMATEQLERTNKEIAELRARTDADSVWHHQYRNHREAMRDGRQAGYYWAKDQITEVQKAHEDGETYSVFYWGDGGNQGPNSRAAGYGTKTLEAAVKEANESYVTRVLAKHVTGLEQYITWQQERVTNWKTQPLTAIK